mmetsp:Transcript_13178/g.52586  ORF Transcript_13178/g.52586 Transcript_13178/m.52586 type:complete len:226 (+) Transcript_13178:393-1070(+)
MCSRQSSFHTSAKWSMCRVATRQTSGTGSWGRTAAQSVPCTSTTRARCSASAFCHTLPMCSSLALPTAQCESSTLACGTACRRLITCLKPVPATHGRLACTLPTLFPRHLAEVAMIPTSTPTTAPPPRRWCWHSRAPTSLCTRSNATPWTGGPLSLHVKTAAAASTTSATFLRIPTTASTPTPTFPQADRTVSRRAARSAGMGRRLRSATSATTSTSTTLTANST